MRKRRKVRLGVFLALASAALVLGQSVAHRAEANGERLASDWRMFFLPASHKSGDFTCHSGHGIFHIASDGSLSGSSQTWMGGIQATFRGHTVAGGAFVGEYMRDGIVGGRSSGRLRASGRAAGRWEEFHSGCQGTWVAEPVPEQPSTRPSIRWPAGCEPSDAPGLERCEHQLADGTWRTVVLAEDVFDASSFLKTFGGWAPGYDRPDLAAEAVHAFVQPTFPEEEGVTRERAVMALDLPYGAIACRRVDLTTTGTDPEGNPVGVLGRSLWCMQPLPDDGSRFTMLLVMDVNQSPDETRLERDTAAIFSSLRLP